MNETEEVDSGRKSSNSDGGDQKKRTGADICREHKINQTLYYRWRDKFLEGGRKDWSTEQETTTYTRLR